MVVTVKNADVVVVRTKPQIGYPTYSNIIVNKKINNNNNNNNNNNTETS